MLALSSSDEPRGGCPRVYLRRIAIIAVALLVIACIIAAGFLWWLSASLHHDSPSYDVGSFEELEQVAREGDPSCSVSDFAPYESETEKTLYVLQSRGFYGGTFEGYVAKVFPEEGAESIGAGSLRSFSVYCEKQQSSDGIDFDETGYVLIEEVDYGESAIYCYGQNAQVDDDSRDEVGKRFLTYKFAFSHFDYVYTLYVHSASEGDGPPNTDNAAYREGLRLAKSALAE